MMRHRYSTAAQQELIDAARYYEQVTPGLGYEFLEDVDTTVDTLVRFPSIAPRFTERTRKAVLRKFPFTLLYSFDDELITIIAVAHQKRKPDYWQHSD